MGSRVIVLLMVVASLLGLGASTSVADEIPPSREFGTHVLEMTPEHPLEDGAMFGDCVSTMATSADCPQH